MPKLRGKDCPSFARWSTRSCAARRRASAPSQGTTVWAEVCYKHPWCSQSNATSIPFLPRFIRNLLENHGVADCDDFMDLAPMQALAMRCQFAFFGGFPAARLLIAFAGLPAQSRLAPLLIYGLVHRSYPDWPRAFADPSGVAVDGWLARRGLVPHRKRQGWLLLLVERVRWSRVPGLLRWYRCPRRVFSCGEGPPHRPVAPRSETPAHPLPRRARCWLCAAPSGHI